MTLYLDRHGRTYVRACDGRRWVWRLVPTEAST